MAAIPHVFVEQNAAQTIASTNTIISGTTISSSNFIVGKKYLLIASGQFWTVNGASAHLNIALRHGSTDFSESLIDHRVPLAISNVVATLAVATIWTAVSSEDVAIWGNGNGNTDGRGDQLFVCAIQLTDYLTENVDWFSNVNTSITALSTTPADFATITFTPATSGDWLVLFTGNTYNTTAGGQAKVEFVRSGEASSATPAWLYNSMSVDGEICDLVGRVFALTAASNTFTGRYSMVSGSSGYHSGSAMIALRLAAFAAATSDAYTDADVNLSATAFATALGSVTITPPVTSDVLIGGHWGFDHNTATNVRTAKMRLQVDGSDQPTGQTADTYNFASTNNAADEIPVSIATMESNVSAASHTITMDGSADSTTNTPSAQHRCLWALTMELATTGGVFPGSSFTFLRRGDL